MSTTITGTLAEIRDTFLVLDGNAHIMRPPGMKVEHLVVGEAVTVSVTAQGGRWTAERIERGPVGGRSTGAASRSGRKNAITCGGGSGACPRG